MPFYGCDWRNSAGEYVKTETGWESATLKKEDACISTIVDESHEQQLAVVYLQRRSTQERLFRTSLDEVFKRLNFLYSARLLSRFGYLNAIIRAWIEIKSEDSGYVSSKKLIFIMLKRLVQFCHENTIKERELRRTIVFYLGEISKHRPLGNESLRTKQLGQLEAMKNDLDQIRRAQLEFEDRKGTGYSLEGLPRNVLEKIVSSLSLPSDVYNLAAVSTTFLEICSREVIWRKLANYHFDSKKAAIALRSFGNWQLAFRKLASSNVLRIEFADAIGFCLTHGCLFWINDQRHSTSTEPCSVQVLSPKQLIGLFD